MIAQKARFRHARKLERLAGYRLPDQAFHGATLEAVSSRLNFDRLDHTLHEQILNFIHSFMRCTCRETPLCGCPEKKFSRENFFSGHPQRGVSRQVQRMKEWMKLSICS